MAKVFTNTKTERNRLARLAAGIKEEPIKKRLNAEATEEEKGDVMTCTPSSGYELISVIIPVLNNTSYTEKLFTNIENNVIKPEEIIIVDDGSTEDYRSLIKKYSHLGIKYIRNNSTIGVNASWNKGIVEAQHPLLSILNNDILINKWFFKKVSDTMADERIGLCMPLTKENAYFTTEEFTDIDEPPVLKTIPLREGWAFTMRKEIITKRGLVPSSLRTFYGDDYLFLISTLEGYKNVKIHNNNIFHVRGLTVFQNGGKAGIRFWMKKEMPIWKAIEAAEMVKNVGKKKYN